MPAPMPPRRALRRRSTVTALLHRARLLAISPILACGGDNLSPPPRVDEGELYWALDLNHHAVTLSTTAPYDTVTLTATPRNAEGAPLLGLGAPQFVSRNIEHLAVSPEGMLVAVKPISAPVTVVAILKVGNKTHTDSVMVRIEENPAPPVLASFSAAPLLPDSAKFAAVTPSSLLRLPRLPARASDSSGTALPGVLVSFRSSDTTIATIHPSNGEIRGFRTGAVTFVASAMLFGIAAADTVPYRIGWPAFTEIKVNRALPAGGGDSVNVFIPSEIVVGTGALVVWSRACCEQTFDIDATFADDDVSKIGAAVTYSMAHALRFPLLLLCGAANCTEGNIAPSANAYRVFRQPGVYEYRSVHGTRGRVVVRDDT